MILKDMGLDENWIEYFMQIYTVSSRLSVNGMLSSPIRIEKGIRQGCNDNFYYVYQCALEVR